MNHSATYSPEDDKLRLYPTCRLSKEDYDRAKVLGFRWAPKQELFYAVWTPSAEDLLIEWCGEITDEDKSLVERAEERAERFQDYSANRLQDAENAHKAVSAIADGIPLGQPILVGHHSERHARRDAAKIENGMRRAVKMWDQSQYWKDRAAGALRHAKYKELPAVRARRIKGLEAELRKILREKELLEKSLRFWTRDDITHDLALEVAGQTELARFVLPRKEGDKQDWNQRCDAYTALTNGYLTLYAERTLEEVIQAGREAFPKRIKHCDRWIEHLSHRLEYEHAMLEDAGGTEADKVKPEVGGGCRCWASPRGGWSYIQKVNKVSVTLLDNWGNGGANFTRTIPFDKLSALMSKAEVQGTRDTGQLVHIDDTGFILRNAML